MEGRRDNVKIGLDCPLCLLHRGSLEIQRATSDPDKQLKTLLKITEIISNNLRENAVPAYVGTLRDRAIKMETGNPDPYKHEKRQSNKTALNLVSKAQSSIANSRNEFEKLRTACVYSAIANLIEFDMLNYSFDFEAFERYMTATRFEIDHSAKALELIRRSRNVVVLTDNAGEIAFDKILVEQLQKLGPRVSVAVKGAPILNDATIEDAEEVGMTNVADEVITTGTDTVGLWIEEASKEFQSRLSKADLAIVKGMGHYETLTEQEIGRPLLYLFVAKCNPVALNVGTKKGNGIILLSQT